MSFRAYGILMPAFLMLAVGLLFLAGGWWGGPGTAVATSLFGGAICAYFELKFGPRLFRDKGEVADKKEEERLVYIHLAPTLILISIFCVLIWQTAPWYSGVAATLVCFLLLSMVNGAAEKFFGGTVGTLGPVLVGWVFPIAGGFTLFFFGYTFWGILVYIVLTSINVFFAAVGFGLFRLPEPQSQRMGAE